MPPHQRVGTTIQNRRLSRTSPKPPGMIGLVIIPWSQGSAASPFQKESAQQAVRKYGRKWMKGSAK
jgi:hypothetical protein